MKITWNFADGTKSEVEVNEELGEFITASRREESNSDRKERYHCYSLDAILFEGKEYGDYNTHDAEIERSEKKKRIAAALETLSEIQKRRLLMLAGGCSVNEIARLEGIAPNAAWKSVEGAKKKFIKSFKMGV